MHALVGLAADHAKVEFILVPQRCFILEHFQAILLAVVVPCALHIVFVLLQQAELLSVAQLATLAMLLLGCAKHSQSVVSPSWEL